LIEASAEIAAPRRVVSAIHRGTGGNPLFVEELVQLLVSEDRLEDAAADAGGRVGIPHGVHEVIGRRLGRVSDDCRRALGVAAVLGRDFDLAGLAEVTGRPTSELLDVLDEAISERIVTEVPGMPDRLRFSHPLIRDVLYEELGASRRRRLHERAGEALEALHTMDPAPHYAELAHHFFEAGPTGDPRRALEYSRLAGDRAISQLAYEEAARLYELGIRVLRTGFSDEARRCELTMALADAQLRAGHEEEARTAFLRAAEIARGVGDADALARAGLGYGGLYVWMAARGDRRLIPLLEEALDSLPDSDTALRARVMARLACAVRDQPDRERRLPLSERAVAIAERLGDQRTLAYALSARCTSVIDPRSMEGFTETARETIRVGEAVGEIERSFIGRFYLLIPLLEAGDIDGTRATLAEMTRAAEELREPAYRWGSAGVQAALALFEGRFEGAEELISSAYRVGRDAQRFNALSSYRLQRFMLRRECGGLEDLEPDLRNGVAEYPTYHVWRCALANLYAELGREAAARVVLDELAAGDFEAVHFDEEFLGSMTFLGDVCRALDDVERAKTLYGLLLPHAKRNAFAMPELILGSTSRPLGELAVMLGRGDEAAAHFERAIEMNERMGARPWVAHARFGLGHVVAQTGQTAAERSASLIAEALAEYRDLGMEPWKRKAERALEELRVRGASG
jgi:tetratricopeptide (TPR) repeat protein